jgi:hypothetical protein
VPADPKSFTKATARRAAEGWSLSGLEREWTRACARADVAHLPVQQRTRHSILTVMGQTLPERVLRDFSRHQDSRSLDRYSKPRATRGALVRAFPGPCVVPGAPSATTTEPNTADISGE